MKKNVGRVDQILRFLLGLFLVWLGIIILKGKDGNAIGIAVAAVSLMPFYIALTRSCFVFRWFKTHSLSKKECEIYGAPYPEKKK